MIPSVINSIEIVIPREETLIFGFLHISYHANCSARLFGYGGLMVVTVDAVLLETTFFSYRTPTF